MKPILEKARYLTAVAALASLGASVLAFAWGVVKTVKVGQLVVRDPASDHIAVGLIETVDAFLIAIALLIFAISVYELFVADLDVPKWLTVTTLHGLKVRVLSVIVLVMAIRYLELFMTAGESWALLQRGIGMAVVSAALIAFARLVPDD